jgi:hypothetical protein
MQLLGRTQIFFGAVVPEEEQQRVGPKPGDPKGLFRLMKRDKNMVKTSRKRTGENWGVHDFTRRISIYKDI